MQYTKVKLGIILTTIISFTLFSNPSFTEIISPQKDEIKFGEWLLICENDVMADIPDCQIANQFYQQSVIKLAPSLKLSNQMIMVIPNLKLNESVQIRIDKNNIIFSSPTKKNDFGLVRITPQQKSTILSQMKNGDFLFIRFNINNLQKTAKLNLKDFRSAVSHYQSTLK